MLFFMQGTVEFKCYLNDMKDAFFAGSFDNFIIDSFITVGK